MYVCLYVCMHVSMYVRVYVCMHASTFVHIYMYVDTNKYTVKIRSAFLVIIKLFFYHAILRKENFMTKFGIQLVKLLSFRTVKFRICVSEINYC